MLPTYSTLSLRLSPTVIDSKPGGRDLRSYMFALLCVMWHHEPLLAIQTHPLKLSLYYEGPMKVATGLSTLSSTLTESIRLLWERVLHQRGLVGGGFAPSFRRAWRAMWIRRFGD